MWRPYGVHVAVTGPRMGRRSGRVEPGQATESLKALGPQKHQALIVVHRGGHLHVIVNRVDAESGKAAGLSRSKLRLSKWAEGYEQGQGWPGSGPRSVRTGSGLQHRAREEARGSGAPEQTGVGGAPRASRAGRGRQRLASACLLARSQSRSSRDVRATW